MMLYPKHGTCFHGREFALYFCRILLQKLSLSENMASTTKDVASELETVLRVYRDGTVERLLGSPFVPPSPQDPTTGVSSKDIAISPKVSARLYLPPLTAAATLRKLPILVYFHGGGFCIESPFSALCHRYITNVVSRSNALAVSVDYRLAPEHPLPAAYDDSWAALQWVAAHSGEGFQGQDPWLISHGDFERVYIGGDSAGANIAHNMAMRAATENLKMRIYGAFLCHPYFWGSKPLGSESVPLHEKTLSYKTWTFVYPNSPGGIDNPMVNPLAGDAPNLSRLKCCRLLVCVAAMDELRERGVGYHAAVKGSGWVGELELCEVKGEGHGFHILSPESDNAEKMIKRLAAFLL
ncbi:2-hydroxyisoflavanone dehydratase-like [Diospyros lotus]|uniref:2-hydroxyisoflavanone dehydratase-like n=1 Tax=Diospyros lotus TaxID=55363 RepID=UPI002256B459|nr:2-hydroxyisoflavanone dehydratase-like [Diospyros lotus]